MFAKFQQRSYELEHLDKGDYTPQEYESCIVELQRVNRWLGDTRALETTLLADVAKLRLNSFSVLDVGAGSGELLRAIDHWARSRDKTAHLVGIELNARSAVAISESVGNISAVRADAFKLPFADNQFDFAICSLFTHHFSDRDVVSVIRELARVASRGIYVIDLHRHPIAYAFFTTVARLFLHNRLIREDGALSILRSFKPHELEQFGKRAGLQNVRVERRFPFRLVLSGHGASAKAKVGSKVNAAKAPSSQHIPTTIAS